MTTPRKLPVPSMPEEHAHRALIAHAQHVANVAEAERAMSQAAIFALAPPSLYMGATASESGPPPSGQ